MTPTPSTLRIKFRCIEKRTITTLPAFGEGVITTDEVIFSAADLEHEDSVASWRPLGRDFSVTSNSCEDIGRFQTGKFYWFECAPIEASTPAIVRETVREAMRRLLAQWAGECDEDDPADFADAAIAAYDQARPRLSLATRETILGALAITRANCEASIHTASALPKLDAARAELEALA